MWKIFRIFKKKKILSMKEYDELIDKKVNNIRDFILTNLTLRDDDDSENVEKFLKEFNKVFIDYQKYLLIKLLKEGQRKEVVKSPYLNFEELFKYGKKKKSRWSFYHNFVFRTKVRIRLFWYQIWLYFQIRKAKKLFPDMKISSKTALGLLKAAKINKKLITAK
jgi:hypothetical protein